MSPGATAIAGTTIARQPCRRMAGSQYAGAADGRTLVQRTPYSAHPIRRPPLAPTLSAHHPNLTPLTSPHPPAPTSRKPILPRPLFSVHAPCIDLY